MKFNPGQIIRFSYKHQATDAATGDKFKEVLVLHPFWNNKVHAIDLKRLSPAERHVLEVIMDPDQNKKPSRIPLINNIMRRMDPTLMIKNPMAFYTQFVKPFLNGKDAYRTYIPHNMMTVTVQKDVKIGTGKKPIENPLFGPKQVQEPTGQPKAVSPIDIMAQNAKNRGLK
jgi:hypothetical protein